MLGDAAEWVLLRLLGLAVPLTLAFVCGTVVAVLIKWKRPID